MTIFVESVWVKTAIDGVVIFTMQNDKAKVPKYKWFRGKLLQISR